MLFSLVNPRIVLLFFVDRTALALSHGSVPSESRVGIRALLDFLVKPITKSDGFLPMKQGVAFF
jgi:hypothetical protein